MIEVAIVAPLDVFVVVVARRSRHGVMNSCMKKCAVTTRREPHSHARGGDGRERHPREEETEGETTTTRSRAPRRRPSVMSSRVKSARLRPIQAPRGARAIVLPTRADAPPTPIGNDAAVLGFTDPTLPKEILSVTLKTEPDVAVELRTTSRTEVFVQDKFGALRMLKANARAFLKRGEVLFLAWSKARGTRFGYVLEYEDDGERAGGRGGGRTRTRSRGGDADANANAADFTTTTVDDNHNETDAEVIDIASDDTETPVKRRKKSSKSSSGSPTGVDGKEPATTDETTEDEETTEEIDEKDKEKTKDPSWEPSSSSARGTRGSDAAMPPLGKKEQAEGWRRVRSYASKARMERERVADEQRRRQAEYAHRDPPSVWGGASAEEMRRQTDSSRIPPEPPEGLPDDPEVLKDSRAALKCAHKRLVAALHTEVAMRQTLAQSQMDFQRTMRGNADWSLRQWHKENLQVVAGKYQQSQFAAAAARSHYQQALQYFHATVERFENGFEGDAGAAGKTQQTTKPGGAKATTNTATATAAEQATSEKTSWKEECDAWETLISTCPHDMSLKDLKMCVTRLAFNAAHLIEREDYIGLLITERETAKERFEKRKKDRAEREKKEAEIQTAQRKKEDEESAKRDAVRQVAVWAMHADLRLFLHRCGLKVEQHGRSNKRTLAKIYRQAMLKYHPDRARQKSVREQALASEVTKWITHAWQQMPP